MSVNNVRHMTWICHLPILHHISTHMLGTHAGFQVISAIRRSFTSETLDRGDPQIYPYSFLRTRADHWTFCLYLCFLAHMYTENQCWTHFTTLFTPVDPYREFR